MPVLNCPCGAEIRVTPGRMLALGAGALVCPDCGLTVVGNHIGLTGQGVADSATNEAEVEFAEFDCGDSIDQDASPPDVEFAAIEIAGEVAFDSVSEDEEIGADSNSTAVDHGDNLNSNVADFAVAPLCFESANDQTLPQFERRRLSLAAFSGSMIFHVITAMILALVISPTLLKPALELIEVDSSWTRLEAETPLGNDGTGMATVAMEQADTSGVHAEVTEMVVARTTTSIAIPDFRPPTTPLPRMTTVPQTPSMSSMLTPVKPLRRSDPNKGGVLQGQTSGQATQGILDGIRNEASKGPIQVVWLMDASISMNVDRQEVAARLVPFYKELAQRDKKETLPVLSSVVTFGEQPVELESKSRNFELITKAVATLQNDPSGLENVMTAVQACVRRHSNKKSTLIIVIFTDESGDDILRLEETIQVCRQRDVIVHVVGPNATFGSERGTHLWQDAESGFTFRLPVKRGPETSLPERLMLPYWHDAKFPAAALNGNLVAQNLPWYGGPMREGILSGFGPFALTRLAMETGGTFTVLDRPGDRTIATLGQLRPYTPDYSSARDYYSETQASPLRKAVSDAAMLIWQSPELTPPPRTFLFSRQAFYPFDGFVNYLNPENFRTGFRQNLLTAIKGSRAELEIMEKALSLFEAMDLEREYEKETSLRWKAWYDVNYGRLLANTVRHLEYQLTCEQILASGALNTDTNHVLFLPWDRYKGGRISEGRAVNARRLLERCRKNNAGTQWDKLAEWELEHELGMQVQQIVIPPPPPPRGSFVPMAPMRPISFPRL